MRIILVALAVVLLALSSCAYLEDLGEFIGVYSKDKRQHEQELQAAECGENPECIREHLASCTPALGIILLNLPYGRETGIIDITGSKKSACSFTYTVTSSYNPAFNEKSLYCLLPPSLVNASFEGLLEPEAGLCAGEFARINSIIFDKKSYFRTQDVVVKGKFVEFTLQNIADTIHLNSIEITGNYFKGCMLTIQRPYRLQKNEINKFSIGCDEISKGHEYYPGSITIVFTVGGETISNSGYFYAKSS